MSISASSSGSNIYHGPICSRSSDFCELLTQATYVDKTADVKTFVHEGVMEVALLLRPRRSGKSTFLSMLQFILGKDEQTEQERLEILEQRRVAILSDVSFDFKAYFARYPVLYLDFLCSIAGDTLSETLQSIRECFAREFYRLQGLGLLDTNDANEIEKDRLKKLRKNKNMNRQDLATIPHLLTKLLRIKNNQRVIVLVDEYDLPLYTSVGKGQQFEQVQDFMRRMYTDLLKANDVNVCGACVTGVHRVAQSGFLSGLNNLRVYALHSASQKYASACMFTREEAQSVYNAHKDGLEFTWDELRKWYNGYTSPKGIPLWNPWSFLSAIEEKSLGAHWHESGSDSVLRQLIVRLPEDSKQKLGVLAGGESCEMTYADTMTYSELVNVSGPPSDDKARNVFGLLLYAGYLCAQPINGPPDQSRLGETREVRSPNLETSLILRRWIEADFHNNFVHNDPRAREVWNRIEQADCHQLRLALEAAIAPVSYHVLNPKECVYEVFLGTLLRCAVGADQWALRYELEVGHGRADLIMWENNGTSAILLELKRLSNAEAAINHGQDLDTRLSARAQDAVQQVQDRQYANGLPDHTLSLQVYGIAWHKKRCQVAGINIVRQPNMLWSAALVTPQAGSV